MTMTKIEQKLGRIEQKLDDFMLNQTGWVKSIDKKLSGNGRPGLMDRVGTLEINEKNCSAKKHFENESKATKWSRIGVAVTLILNTILIIINLKLMIGGN